MEVKDLMIGDWVQVPSELNRYKRIRSTFDMDSAILYEPIPLTTEILKKNGFDISDPEVKQYHFEEDGQRYHFSLRQMYNKDNNPDGYSFYAFSVLTIIDYVHQLQHALRLCGIDKEIEL